MPSVSKNTVEIKELQSEIDRLQSEVKSKKLSPRDQYVLNDINKYGINNVIALALNGRYECPSAKEQKIDRCDAREEVTIMFTTLNLAKQDKRTIEETVYFKHSNGVYMFSWVPKIGGNKDTTSPIFKHSLELAFQVLGGNGSDISALLISDHPSSTSYDGYLLTTNYDALQTRMLPSESFTFENFGEESISQSFFLSNVSATGDVCSIVVIFEGFVND